MKSQRFVLTSRSVPLDDAWDVVVVGGGPSGCTAAAAAARDGARTLLIEQSGNLGGMGTSALVPAWTPFSDKEQIVYRGLAETVFKRAKQGVAHVKPEDRDWVPIDAERLKRVYDDLVTEHGATVLFHTMLSAVETDGQGRVTHLLVTNKRGLSAIGAKVFIDCTGDADLCAWAGAGFHKGDDQGDPKSLMPTTHCFVLSNVDDYAYRTGPVLHGGNPDSPVYAIVASGKYPLIPDVHLCQNTVGPGTVGFNAGHVYAVDSTDPENVSRAMMLGRKIAAAYRDALAEFYPAAFANSHLVQTGSALGVRESRRIVGDYVLTLEDYLRRRSFDDEICRNSYFIDVHAKVKAAFESLQGMESWEKATIRYGRGESHGIPYRCLTPVGLHNVLVAGRSISTEQLVQGSVRVMPCCLAMGEAAGTAAAIAVATSAGAAGRGMTESEVLPDVRRHVDCAELRRRLRAAGAYLPENVAPQAVRAGTTDPVAAAGR